VNPWSGSLSEYVNGPSAFDSNLTGHTYELFLRNDLPGLLKDIPLIIWKQFTSNMIGLPSNPCFMFFPNRWLGRGGSHALVGHHPGRQTFHHLITLNGLEGDISVRNKVDKNNTAL
jgi:hypothetical protein